MTGANPIYRLFLILFSALTVVACGGGGSSSGIDRLGATSGTVTGFGSVYVKGTRYDTDSATFDIDDDDTGSSQQDLAVGDVVTVVFSTAAPTTALAVIADEAVEGPVDSIGPDPDTLVVAGQTVIVTADTSFDDAGSLADFAVGDFVEVSGHVVGTDTDATNATAISATRIEKKADCATPGDCKIEVHGNVSELDTPTAGFFMINELVVDYLSAPAILDDLPGDALADGLQVEVKGMTYDDATQTLVATKIEGDSYENELGDVDEYEIEGQINRFSSDTDFFVDDIPVTTTDDTEYEPEGLVLGDGLKVEVEGAFNDAGVLVAEEIKAEERSDDVRIRAEVQDVGAETLTLLGIVVRVDERTRVEDKTGEDRDRSESFGLGDIRVGEYVEVRGGSDPLELDDVLATRLERLEPPKVAGEGTELHAYVEDISDPFVTIEGVMVDTTDARFYDETTEESIDAATFFNRVEIDDLVDVSGTETGTESMRAKEVELED